MARWPRDNQADLIRFYGVPGAEVEAQLVRVVPPFQMYYDGKPISFIKFHRKAADALKAALEEIWEHYGHDQRKIDSLGISKYAGAYNPRKIRGSATRWSNHAFGAAIDLDAERNGFNTGYGTMPQPVVDAFKRQGARWGGDYRGRTDPMHFEFCDAGEIARPQGIMDTPQVDGDSDAQHESDEPHDDTPATTQDSWIKRRWKSLTSWIGGAAGTGVLGYLTSPWAIVAVFGCLLIIAIIVVLFIGPSRVRAWLRRQVLE